MKNPYRASGPLHFPLPVFPQNRAAGREAERSTSALRLTVGPRRPQTTSSRFLDGLKRFQDGPRRLQDAPRRDFGGFFGNRMEPS